MNRLGTAVGAGLLLILGAACANPQEDKPANQPGSPNPTQTAPPPVGQPGVPPPAANTPVPPEKLDTSALPKGFKATVSRDADGRSILLVGREGGCSRASAEVAEQNQARVVIKLVETTPKDAKACTMDIRYPKLNATLAEPLGERTIALIPERRTV
ncbi:hypothetical protein [Herbihabitans rhizosphaerae]|nr:hypothetical protein [Herbihabitans rhizosphaerae]